MCLYTAAVESRPLGPIDVGNGATREVEREASLVDDDFDDMRILGMRLRGQRRPKGGHRDIGVGFERAQHEIDHARLDERLVGLQVDDELSREVARDLREPFRAVAMIGARQPDVSAKSPHDVAHPIIIGGNQHRRGPRRRDRVPIDVFDHRTPRNIRKRFTWQSRRTIPSGNDDDSARRRDGR